MKNFQTGNNWGDVCIIICPWKHGHNHTECMRPFAKSVYVWVRELDRAYTRAIPNNACNNTTNRIPSHSDSINCSNHLLSILRIRTSDNVTLYLIRNIQKIIRVIRNSLRNVIKGIQRNGQDATVQTKINSIYRSQQRTQW